MKIVIVAGGTGGHIYPGIALAEGLGPIHNILFVASTKAIEKEILKKEGFKHKFIEARAFVRKLSLKSFFAPFICLIGFFQSIFLLLTFRPKIVISMGGYASLPVVLAAYILRIPIFIHEQNVLPGFSNRISSLFAEKVFISFEESRVYFKNKSLAVTGNPIRKKILTVTKNEARKMLGLPNDKKIILFVGGSQGAKAINQTIIKMLPMWQDEEYFLYHITGTRDYEFVKQSLPAKYPNYANIAYRDDIWNAIAAADLVVSRAGATLIAEILARGVPALLIPYPFAANFHQDLNAEVLSNQGKALTLKEKDLTPQTLIQSIKEACKLKVSPSYLNATQNIINIINEYSRS